MPRRVTLSLSTDGRFHLSPGGESGQLGGNLERWKTRGRFGARAARARAAFGGANDASSAVLTRLAAARLGRVELLVGVARLITGLIAGVHDQRHGAYEVVLLEVHHAHAGR
jgi:hypothetical protein